MKRFLLFVIMFFGLASSYAQEPVPDSLVGMYKGLFYFKYFDDPDWTITSDTTYVTDINIGICGVVLHGPMGVWNAAGFETWYSYCYGNSAEGFTRFFDEDSLFISFSGLSMPPPDYHPYSIKFRGKRVPDSSYVGIVQKTPTNQYRVYPCPAREYIILEYRQGEPAEGVFCQIYDLTGRKGCEEKTGEGGKVNVSRLKDGVYELMVSDKRMPLNVRFIKLNEYRGR